MSYCNIYNYILSFIVFKYSSFTYIILIITLLVSDHVQFNEQHNQVSVISILTARLVCVWRSDSIKATYVNPSFSIAHKPQPLNCPINLSYFEKRVFVSITPTKEYYYRFLYNDNNFAIVFQLQTFSHSVFKQLRRI